MRSLLRRLHYLLHRSRIDAELAEEIDFHEAMKSRELEAAGLSSVEARHSARRALGNITSTEDDARDVWLPPALQGTAQDVRLAFRTLRKTPIVTSAAVLSIALGIGANTALFSVLDALVLRTLPVEEPDRLMFVRGGSAPDATSFTHAVWHEIRDRSPFENLASWSMRRFNFASGDESHLVQGMWASGSYFDTLGVRAALGRTLTPADDVRGGGPDGPVAVISYGFWQREFGGADDVIGRTLRLDGVPFIVVGVTPSSFLGTNVGREFEVAIPLETEPLMHAPSLLEPDTGTFFLSLVGRLRPNQSPEQALSALRQLQPAIREATIGPLRKFGPQYVSRYLTSPFTVTSAATGTSALRAAYERPLMILMIVVVVVMLIACANIANLLLARAIARRQEIDVRAALGASPWRIGRQLFVESAVLSIAGSLAGLLVAHGAAPALVAQFSTAENPVRLNLNLDTRVLAFTAALTIITTLLFGTVPAFVAARRGVESLVAPRVAQQTLSNGGLASWLTIGQVALAMMLLVAGVLFIRTFVALTTRPLGFEPEAVLVALIDPPRTVAPKDRIALYGRLLAAVRDVPDVAESSVSVVSPMTSQYTPPIEILDSRANHRGEHSFANLISPGWFKTYQIPLVAGRDFAEGDRRGAARVAIVNETFARRFLDRTSVLGRRLAIYPDTPMTLSPVEVVGVVADAVYSSLRDPAPPTIYLPIDQMDHPAFPLLRENAAPTVRLSVRPRTGTPNTTIKSVVAVLAAVEPRLTVTFQSLAEQIDASVRQDRVVAWLSGLFAALALLLTALGLHGLIAYGIQARRRELSIRTALGATAGEIVAMVLRRVSLLTAVGISIGIVLALLLGRGIATMLYGVMPHDFLTFVASAVLLALVAVAAALGPIRAALRLPPAEVLKGT